MKSLPLASALGIPLRSTATVLAFAVLFAGLAAQSMQAHAFTVLYNFSGSPNGEYSYAGVVRDAAGNLYGTTSQGGTGNCYQGCGLVFKIDQAGKETVLHSFTGGSDGGYPYPIRRAIFMAPPSPAALPVLAQCSRFGQ